MIRLFIDKLGDGHKDLFLKIDLIPAKLIVTDSYYLADFLELELQIEENITHYLALKLLEYWKEILKLVNEKIVFIPFPLSDQYVKGLIVEKNKIGLKINLAFNQEIQGYSINKSSFNQRVLEVKNSFQIIEETQWIISKQQFAKGINWSINEIKSQFTA